MAHINTHKVWSYLDSRIHTDARELIIDQTVDRLVESVSLSENFNDIYSLLKRDIDIYVATFVPKDVRPHFYTLAEEVIENFYYHFPI